MNNNEFSIESFISFCYDMMIAEEGKIADLARKFFRNAPYSSISDIKKKMREDKGPSPYPRTPKTNVNLSDMKKKRLITKEEFNDTISKIKSIVSSYNNPEFKYWEWSIDKDYMDYCNDKYDNIIIGYLYFCEYVEEKYNGDVDSWIESDDYKKFNKSLDDLKNKLKKLSTNNLDIYIIDTAGYSFVRIEPV